MIVFRSYYTKIAQMKTIITFLLLIATQLIFAQTIFTVDNFSNNYYGQVQINDTTQVFSQGWVGIFDKKTKKQLIKVDSQELTFELHEDKVLANIKELPYGEQSQILYEDYNFDGIKDFAIMDGQNSCYHGPSFQIYLASDSGFKLSPEFTKLAQNYCGMFDIDNETKTIHTMTKSGCCWHEFSEFVVENNKPKVIKIITDEQDLPFTTLTEEIWNGKRMVKKTTKTIDTDQEDIQVILSFIVPENGKKIILYSINDIVLNYAILRKDDMVEFSYPAEIVYKHPDFRLTSSSANYSVVFVNNNVTYKIYDQPNKLGMEITIDGKTYNLVGNTKTRTGGLHKLLKLQLDNVVNQ